jgi:Zn ribbon nucleic-acid-binding protein
MTQAKYLKCPHCGVTDLFELHEEQTVHCSYLVINIIGGTLRVCRTSEHIPLGDPGTGDDLFIECVRCGKEFPVPTELALKCVP